MINYTLEACSGYSPDPSEPIMKSLFQQYERVIVESLIRSFGLDFIVKDQFGGDVDTIYNVRNGVPYKNIQNQQDYKNRGAYNSHEYHQDPRYIAANRRFSAQKKSGELYDAYTGEKFATNAKTDLDHIVAAKEIHDDPGRVLAGVKGTDLANSERNFASTNPHTNRSKKADSMDKFLERCGDEYSDEQKANMLTLDAAARKDIDAKISQAYYTSPKFAKDLSVAAGTVALKMGVRQALGFVFAEMWFAVKEEFNKLEGGFNLGAALKSFGNGLKKGFENAKVKYKELFSKFFSGSIAGSISSLTTTLCNVFFTTSKNTIRLIRESYASLVEAAKILFINPQNYPFGERMRAVVKVLATGASVVAGVMVNIAIGSTPLGQFPVIGDIVQTFCGAMVTGILSCTLLYLLDHSEIINKLVNALNNLHTIEAEINYYRRQADYFEKYAAELMKIDIDTFRKETDLINGIADMLTNAKTDDDLNNALKDIYKKYEILIPWGESSFCDFMRDKNSRLVFS